MRLTHKPERNIFPTKQSNIANPRWRINHLYSIVTKDSQLKVFKENEIQKRINDCISKRKMILKARQFGVTTNELIKMLDFTLNHRNVTCCILAHEKDVIEKLFLIPRKAYDNLHGSWKPALDRGGGSKYEMHFPSVKSRIYCDLSVRGGTINWLHISEAAFIKDEGRILATLEAVPINGIVTFETTANGMGNHFYERWTKDDPQYAKLFFPWFLFSEYAIPTQKFQLTDEEIQFAKRAKEKYGVDITFDQINFRRMKKHELGKIFIQEYPEDDQSCFLSTGNAAIDLFKVKEQIEAARPIASEKDGFIIFEPIRNHQHYVIGADTAEGVGGDRSVATVFNARTREQVAIIKGQYSPGDFAHKINQLAMMYRSINGQMPIVAVERNNHGHAVLLELNDHIRYPALYRTSDGRPGWVTDRVTRPIMLDAFISGIENKTIKLNCRDTLAECLTLIVDNGKIEAAPNKKDDCVIAGAIGLQMCIEHSSNIYDNIASKIRI